MEKIQKMSLRFFSTAFVWVEQFMNQGDIDNI